MVPKAPPVGLKPVGTKVPPATPKPVKPAPPPPAPPPPPGPADPPRVAGSKKAWEKIRRIKEIARQTGKTYAEVAAEIKRQGGEVPKAPKRAPVPKPAETKVSPDIGKATTLRQATAHAESLGIRYVDYRLADVETANQVNRQLAKYKEQGLVMPHQIHTQNRPLSPTMALVNDIRVQGIPHPPMTINAGHPVWRTPGYAQREMLESGWMTQTSVVLHELGHIAHYHNSDSGTLDRLRSMRFSGDEARIARKVSRYAGKNPMEFVAEVFAGMKAGSAYGGDVMEMYKKFRGPLL